LSEMSGSSSKRPEPAPTALGWV